MLEIADEDHPPPSVLARASTVEVTPTDPAAHPWKGYLYSRYGGPNFGPPGTADRTRGGRRDRSRIKHLAFHLEIPTNFRNADGSEPAGVALTELSVNDPKGLYDVWNDRTPDLEASDVIRELGLKKDSVEDMLREAQSFTEKEIGEVVAESFGQVGSSTTASSGSSELNIPAPEGQAGGSTLEAVKGGGPSRRAPGGGNSAVTAAVTVLDAVDHDKHNVVAKESAKTANTGDKAQHADTVVQGVADDKTQHAEEHTVLEEGHTKDGDRGGSKLLRREMSSSSASSSASL